ncbi:hypothetical protein AN640_03875 [Candidatus Epulonipiscium fishelsonii]|uniref:Uncharacterized protein n=1 Tax=Candidatus Epulonipiscium fishelsonii TaxID=77094 RepID=A0ACC8XIS6_9FIRM|nr:hypothetical protein AN640_03875 [Epulopiscium sp. SCG-D08WGA-EpuloA1]
MANKKFSRRLSLAMAMITSATPIMVSAEQFNHDFNITQEHTDITDITEITTYDFGHLEDAIINAHNLVGGTIASDSDGSDVDGKATDQAYHWTTTEMKTTYDSKVTELLAIIEAAQNALIKLNNNYADSDVSTTRASIVQGSDETIGMDMTAVNAAITPITTELSRTTGISVSYQGHVDGLYRAILAAEELIATTESAITQATTNGEYMISSTDGKDVEKGKGWISKADYDAFKVAIDEAKDYLTKVYRSTSPGLIARSIPVANPDISREKILEMANNLYGVQTSGDTYVANTVDTAIGAALAFKDAFAGQMQDGEIVIAREGLESLIDVSNIHLNVTTANKEWIDNVTTADLTITEDTDEDNTRFLYNTSGHPYYIDPNNEYYLAKEEDDTFPEGVTTATVTHVLVSDIEGRDLWASWVTTADVDILTAAVAIAEAAFEANDGIVDGVFAPTDESETSHETTETIDKAINILKRALNKFIDSYEEGQMPEIIEEKEKLQKAIFEAQLERGYTTSGVANADISLVVQQDDKHGTQTSEAYMWVSTIDWTKLDTAITSAKTLYDATTGAHDLLDYENGVIAIENATLEFATKIEEGFKEDYAEVMGVETDLKSKGLLSVVAAARAEIGDAKVENGVLSGPTDDSTFTVKPSSIEGADVTSPSQWVATETYKAYVEIVQAIEEIKDQEVTTPLYIENQILPSGEPFEYKDRLKYIEQKAKELYAATSEFKQSYMSSGSEGKEEDTTEFNALLEKAMALTTTASISIYEGLDLLTTTTTVTNIDGTTTGSIKTYEVTTDSVKYISKDNMQALIDAIFVAQEFKNEKLGVGNTTLPSEVERAMEALNAAVIAFNSAAKTPTDVKSRLFNLIYGEDGNSGYASELRNTKVSNVGGVEVKPDEFWATPAVKAAFDSAVDKAIVALNNQKIYPGPAEKSGTVEKAIIDLELAKSKFITAPGVGTLVPKMNELSDKVNEAKALIIGNTHLDVEYIDDKTPEVTTSVYTSIDNGKNKLAVTTDSNGVEITTQEPLNAGDKWVTEAEMRTFISKIAVAETAWKSTRPTDATISKAIVTLQTEITKFLDLTAKTAVGATSAATLRTEFETLYNTAATAVYNDPANIIWGKGYKILISRYYGADIENTVDWTDAASIGAINNAIKAADLALKNEAINKLTHDQFKAAYDTFKAAYDIFFGVPASGDTPEVVGKLQKGFKEREDDALVLDVEAANALLLTVKRSAINGQDVAAGDKWVDAKYYDAFKKAIETAEALLLRYTGSTTGGLLLPTYVPAGMFNMSYFNTAQVNLQKAVDVFKQYIDIAMNGSDLLAPVKTEYITLMNFVNDIVGLPNYDVIDSSTDFTTVAGTAITDLQLAFADKDFITQEIKDKIPAAMEGIRKSVYNNGVDVEGKYLWMSAAVFSGMENTLKLHRGYYSNPSYDLTVMGKYIETLEKNIATWLAAGIKSGAGTKDNLDGLRTTISTLIIDSHALIGKIAAINADGTGFDISDGGTTFQISDLKGTDVDAGTAWASKSNTATFTNAINAAMKAFSDIDITQINLEKAITALKLANDKFVGLDANADGDYADRGDYAPQYYTAGATDIDGTIAALNSLVARAKNTMAMIKITPLGTGSDVSNTHTLVSSLDRASGKTIIEEISAAYNIANSMSRARKGAYAEQELLKVTNDLKLLIDEVDAYAYKGNKEDTLLAKADLKKEMDAAKLLLRYTISSTSISGKEDGKYYLSPFAIRDFEEIIDQANAVYINRYASVEGTMYTPNNDGTVTESKPTAAVLGKRYEAIGSTTTTAGIRSVLYNATQWFEYHSGRTDTEPTSGNDPFEDSILDISALIMDGEPIGDSSIFAITSEEEREREEEEREEEEREEEEREEEEREREEQEREEQEREEQEREEQEREEQEREEQEREEQEREEQEREEQEREEQEREEQEREEQEREEQEREEQEREEQEREEQEREEAEEEEEVEEEDEPEEEEEEEEEEPEVEEEEEEEEPVV